MVKQNYSDGIKCSVKKKDINDYIRGLRATKIKTKCKKSCTTMEFSSAFLHQFQDKHRKSAIEIRFDSTVTEWESSFTETPFSVLEALGSSLGLWLGLGVLYRWQKKSENFYLE